MPRTYSAVRFTWSSTALAPLLLSVSLSAGCANVDPAPQDLDGLIHFFWSSYERGSDPQIAEGVRNLHAAAGSKLVDARDGSFSDLSTDQLADIGLEGTVDPAAARGMFLVNIIPCPLASLERIVYALNQDDLYTDVYDRYERTYTSDFDAYVARDATTLTWDVRINATVLGTSYEETLHGGARFIPAIDEVTTPLGPILLARTWMPEPARFDSDSKSFDQDYQIEVYYERAPGEVVHLYGMWRKMDMGTFLNLTTENDELVSTILGNLADWDEQTGKLCKQGKV